MNTKPEEEEGFAGVCSLCGTDCGGVSEVFDDLSKLRKEYEELRGFYMELLLAVESKHQDETRHQTALRYIRQAENQISGPSQEKCS
jgi:hypothetical protein